jgi:hypothetical protein
MVGLPQVILVEVRNRLVEAGDVKDSRCPFCTDPSKASHVMGFCRICYRKIHFSHYQLSVLPHLFDFPIAVFAFVFGDIGENVASLGF